MSTDKGESDLDVFKDLKPRTPDGKPITDSKKTLMGIAVPDSILPPVPGSAAPGASPVAGGVASSLAPSAGPPPVPASVPPSAAAAGRTSVPPPPPSRRGLTPSPPAANGPAEAESPESGPAEGSPSLPPPDRALAATPEAGGLTDIDAAAGDRQSKLGLDSWATMQRSAPDASSRPVASPAVTSIEPPADDVGWDDDDDKTTIYDKDTQSAAQSLLQPSTGGYATMPGGRPPPPMSRPPGALASPTRPAFVRTTTPPQHAEVTVPAMGVHPVRSGGVNPIIWYAFAIVLAGLAGLAFYSILPKKGGLTITVAGGPANRPVSQVEIYVDGKLRCTKSPCQLEAKPGIHLVRVRAAGYQETAEQAVTVSEKAVSIHNVPLMRSGTGIKVFGEGPTMALRVDGREYGPLPQELREMEPGEHVIQVSGGLRYENFQRRITVDPDVMTPIGPIKLKVLKGLVTIRAGEGAEGADVTLRVGNTRKSLPALPVRLEVETNRKHVLVARKKGYAPFEEEIRFEDGHAEKTIDVTLTGRSVESPRSRSGRPSRSPAPATATASSEEGEDEGEPAAAGGVAMLNLSSTPPSNVLLDGKPLGSTPLSAVEVTPGPHRVIFISGSERKPKSVNAVAGKTKSVSVKF